MAFGLVNRWKALMPQILVVADGEADIAGRVVYRERISSSDLESAHFSGQLVERVGWAVRDANVVEYEEPRGLAQDSRHDGDAVLAGEV